MAKSNILLIDDSPGISALMLKSRGYAVNVALNGMEGIEKAIAEHPDLILLDIMMPGMDGYETCMRLREEQNTKNIPIISQLPDASNLAPTAISLKHSLCQLSWANSINS